MILLISSPIVSARQVVATPITSGEYNVIRFLMPFIRLSSPPYTVPCSVRTEEAMSIGSL